MARIKDFTLTTTLAGDDYLPLDGATNGTRAILTTNLRTALGLGTGNTPTLAGLTATGEIRTANAQNIVVRNAADNAAAARLSADASNNAYLDAPANTELRLQVGSSTKLTLTSTGNATLTGNLVAGGTSHVLGSSGGSSVTLSLNAAASQLKFFVTQTSGVDRWYFGQNSVAESGSNAGSNIQIVALSDAGATIDTPFHIARAAGGAITLARPLVVSGNVTASGTLHALGANAGGSATLNLNAAAAAARSVKWQTAGVDRWRLWAENSAEGGANAGTAFALTSYADNGDFLRDNLIVTRANGAGAWGGSWTTSGNLVIGTGSTQKTISATADITVGGNDTVSIGSPSNRLYQVFTNRIGASGQTLTAEGNLSVNGTGAANILAAAVLHTGTGATTEDAQINVGHGRTGSGNAFIDLIGDTTHTDFGLRIRRHNTGANAPSSLDHRGTGVFSINAADGGTIALNAPTTLKGTTTNDGAAAGYVGEYVASNVISGSAVALTTAVAANLTSISLTAGDWEVTASFHFGGGAITGTEFLGSISTTSATLDSSADRVGSTPVSPTVDARVSVQIPTVRVSIASTATYYAVARGTFTAGSATVYGNIRARRIR